MNAEAAAKAEGWRLDPDGAFRHDAERLDDGSLASFWYDGDWTLLCGEAGIDCDGGYECHECGSTNHPTSECPHATE